MEEDKKTVTVGKRGKDKTPRKRRPDKGIQPQPGDNTKLLQHDMKLFKLKQVNMNDPEAVRHRVELYFDICAEDDTKPSIASLALAFGVSRFVLFDWINGRNGTIKNPECVHALKSAYNIINSYYEHMMNLGRINPVSGIFLMKNNMGYQDTTNYIVSTNNDRQETVESIADRAGLLSD